MARHLANQAMKTKRPPSFEEKQATTLAVSIRTAVDYMLSPPMSTTTQFKVPPGQKEGHAQPFVCRRVQERAQFRQF